MWRYSYEIAGGILIVLSSLVSEKMPERWRYWMWAGFVVLALTYSGVGIHLSKQDKVEQGKRDTAIHDLGSELEQSLLAQQYTKGQLDSLSLMVGRLGQPSPQGDALAAAIKQMAHATAQNAVDLKASSTELCKRARVSAEKIRVFQGQFDSTSRAEEEQEMEQGRLAKTDEERHALFRSEMQKAFGAQRTHEAEFRSKYMPEAKYLRDLLMNRIPPTMSSTLINGNGQAEGNLSDSTLNGAFNEYGIATYLDELANAVCPQTAEEKKAIQIAYRAIALRLHEFESQGNKFHDRCAVNSPNPPSATEVDAWINRANAYVRSSTLEEHLKTEFEDVGTMSNATYVSVAPACARLTGKIINTNSHISVLEQHLADREWSPKGCICLLPENSTIRTRSALEKQTHRCGVGRS